jgi:single-stranded DNA-specific DHH superfamily exonuclease
MIPKKYINEIREHLGRANNPLFFFDNDGDGLCSFLLLRRFCNVGKGVCVKGELSKDYFRKVKEFDPDYIFILDKAAVSEEFYKKVQEINLPVVCIDHHPFESKDIPSFVNYYNPLIWQDVSVPVTYFCYKAIEKKEDLWIAVVGCVADRFVPEFYRDFEKLYPDLSCEYKDAFDIRYRSRIGKIIRIFNFALKDKTTNVILLLKFLLKVRTPYEIFEEGTTNYHMHKRFNFIEKKYRLLVKKAIEYERFDNNVLFFKYGGDMSISSDLSDELCYIFPKKLIIVVHISDVFANVSIRGKNALKILKELSKEMDGINGGGHENSVGVRVSTKLLEQFEKKILKIAERKI